MATLSQPETWRRLVCHAGKLKSIVLKNEVPPWDADDVVHDAIIKAAEGIDTLKDPAKLEPWANIIARNQAMEYHRRKSRERKRTTSLDEISEKIRSIEEDGALCRAFYTEEEVRAITPEILHKAMESLSPKEKLVFRLYVQKGYKQRDIAAMTGTSHSNVRVICFRAKEKLEKSLIDYLKEEESYETAKI